MPMPMPMPLNRGGPTMGPWKWLSNYSHCDCWIQLWRHVINIKKMHDFVWLLGVCKGFRVRADTAGTDWHRGRSDTTSVSVRHSKDTGLMGNFMRAWWAGLNMQIRYCGPIRISDRIRDRDWLREAWRHLICIWHAQHRISSVGRHLGVGRHGSGDTGSGDTQKTRASWATSGVRGGRGLIWKWDRVDQSKAELRWELSFSLAQRVWRHVICILSPAHHARLKLPMSPVSFECRPTLEILCCPIYKFKCPHFFFSKYAWWKESLRRNDNMTQVLK
jgi:hypothetical protein